MGFLDDLTATLNKGASVTAKTANVLKLKAQIADLNNQRKNLCSGLGAALYEKTKDGGISEDLRQFYDGIDNCDKRIADLQKQIEQVEASGPTRARSETRWMKTCPNCGFRMNANDVFCSRCGVLVPPDENAGKKAAPGPQQPNVSYDAAQSVPQTPGSNEPIDVNPQS